MDLHERIKFWRKNAELTQTQLAAAVGVTVSAVCLWEGGRTSPGAARLPAIAEACGVPLRVFFSDLPRRARKAPARAG